MEIKRNTSRDSYKYPFIVTNNSETLGKFTCESHAYAYIAIESREATYYEMFKAIEADNQSTNKVIPDEKRTNKQPQI